MKKVLTGSVMALMVLFLSVGLGLAGEGHGKGHGSGQGPGDGTGPIHDILLGDDFTYSGIVTEIVPGDGYILDDGEIVIYGIGPDRYWESLGVFKPTTYEEISVEGYVLVLDGVERYIAFIITVGDETIQLRDPDTGAPLWRGQQNRGGQE